MTYVEAVRFAIDQLESDAEATENAKDAANLIEAAQTLRQGVDLEVLRSMDA